MESVLSSRFSLRLPLLIAALLISSLSFPQIIRRGKVVEISGGDTTAVPGALVIAGTEVTTTDAEGAFVITGDSVPAAGRVRAVGYDEKKFVFRDDAFHLIVLKASSGLKEVEIVYYSSGTEVSMLNAIRTETLNERSLMKAACCNLSESFETNPAIDVNFADAISGTKQIQMLGLSGQYAQITKENMPYMRGLANNYGLTFIPGTWIRSIQLSKGAGSVVNGYESFTGQINTELHDPLSSDRLQFNAYVNQNARNEYNLTARQKLHDKLSTALLAHVSANPMAEDRNGDGLADIPTGEQYNFMNKYAFQSGRFEAQFGGGYLRDLRNGGQFDMFNMETHPHGQLYKIGISNTKWEAYSKTGYVFRKPGTSTGLQLSYLDHDQHDRFGNNQYDGRQRTLYANYIFQGIIGTTDHTYKIGTSFMKDDVDEQFGGKAYARQERTGGAFAEYAYNYRSRFNLVAGLRADQHNYYGFFVTPRLHLRYAFTENSVLRISGGRALRTPNVFADHLYLMATSRSWSIESGSPGLPYGLDAERAWNYGLNFTRKFRINYREAYFTVDAYRTDFISQVVTDVDNDPQQVRFYNLKGPSYSNAVQLEFSAQPKKRLFTKVAYRLVDTRVSYGRGLLAKPLVSLHRGFFNTSYETRDKHWQFDFTVQYNGSKRLPWTQGNPPAYRREAYSPDYYNLLGQVTWLTKIGSADFHVYVGVENLLDYRQDNPVVDASRPFGPFFDASMVWGPIYGRMLYAGLRYKIK